MKTRLLSKFEVVFGLLAVVALLLAACQPASVSSAPQSSAAPVVQLSGNDKLGKFLVAANNNMTLYTFAKDQPGVSNCAGQCATNWPPLLVQDGQALGAGTGVTGKLATIKRADGGTQVTYNGMPVYFFIKDKAPGDTNGQGVGGTWVVAAP